MGYYFVDDETTPTITVRKFMREAIKHARNKGFKASECVFSVEHRDFLLHISCYAQKKFICRKAIRQWLRHEIQDALDENPAYLLDFLEDADVT